MQVVRPTPQLNTTQMMNNFVNQQRPQNTQNFLELLNSSTGGDGKIKIKNKSKSDV